MNEREMRMLRRRHPVLAVRENIVYQAMLRVWTIIGTVFALIFTIVGEWQVPDIMITATTIVAAVLWAYEVIDEVRR